MSSYERGIPSVALIRMTDLNNKGFNIKRDCAPGTFENTELIHRVTCHIDNRTRNSRNGRLMPSYIPLGKVVVTDKQYNINSLLREFRKLVGSGNTSWIGDLRLVDCITGGRTSLTDLGFVVAPPSAHSTAVSQLKPHETSRVTRKSRFLLFVGSHHKPQIQIWPNNDIKSRPITVTLSKGDAVLLRSGVRYRHTNSKTGYTLPYAIFQSRVKRESLHPQKKRPSKRPSKRAPIQTKPVKSKSRSKSQANTKAANRVRAQKKKRKGNTDR